MRYGNRILGILGIWLASTLIGPILAQDLTVDGYSLVSKSRVSRTEFEYTYRANITNTGLEVENVAAALSSVSPHTVVVDADLSFGAVGPGAMVTSNDTFTIRQNRLYPFSWADLSWNVSAQVPALEVAIDEVNRVTATVTPEGGAVVVANSNAQFTLTFPFHALTEPKEITVTPVSALEGLPLSGPMLAAVQLGPQGLQLPNPATLMIELMPSGGNADLVGFVLQDDGEGFHLHPVTISDNKAVFEINHFTIAGIAPGSCIDVNALNIVTGTTPAQLAKNQMAILAENVRRCEALDPEEVSRIIRDIHFDWFYMAGGVSDLISRAKTNPAESLFSAIVQLNSWFASLVYGLSLDIPASVSPADMDFAVPFDCGHPDGILCSDLTDVAEAAAASIFTGFINAVIFENNNCLAGGLNQDAGAVAWIDFADVLPLSGEYWLYEESGVWDIEMLLDLKTCGLRSLVIAPAISTLSVTDSEQLIITGKDQFGNTISLGDPPSPYREINFEKYANSGALNINRTANDIIQITALAVGEARITVGIALSGGTLAYIAEASVTIEDRNGMTGDWHWEFADLTLSGGCPEPWWPWVYQGVRGPRIVTFTQTGNILTVDDPELNATWSGAITDTGNISLTSTYPEPQVCSLLCSDIGVPFTGCTTTWTATGSVSGDTFTLDASYVSEIECFLDIDGPGPIPGTDNSTVCWGTDRVTGVRQ